MVSIADLIYGNSSKKSPTVKNEASASIATTTTPTSTAKKVKLETSHGHAMRRRYQYDEVDDYYNQDPATRLSFSAAIAAAAASPEESRKRPRSEEFTNGQESSTALPPSSLKKKSERKYDYELRHLDRELFQDEELDDNTAKRKRSNKLASLSKAKRHRVYDTETQKVTYPSLETPEEYEHRQNYIKKKRAIRMRFSRKRYNMEQELDAGDHVGFRLRSLGISNHMKVSSYASGDGTVTDMVKKDDSLGVSVPNKNDSMDDDPTVEHSDELVQYSTSPFDDLGAEETQESHVIGSLIERVEARNIAEKERQQLQYGKEFVEQQRDERTTIKKEDPTDFLRFGYAAGRKEHLQRESKVKNLSDFRETMYLQANAHFFNLLKNNICNMDEGEGIKKTKYQRSMKKLYKHAPGQGQVQIGEVVRKRLQNKSFHRKGGLLPMEYLPLSRYNSSIHYERNPDEKDIYYYYPTSFDHNPKSQRLNVAKGHYSIRTLFSDEATVKGWFNGLHFHSRNTMRLAARWIVGCSGTRGHLPSALKGRTKRGEQHPGEKSNVMKGDDDDNSTTGDAYTTKDEDTLTSFRSDLFRTIQMLHRINVTSSHTSILMRYSVEMARNAQLWQAIKDQLDVLLTSNVPGAKHVYESIESDLLSSTSRMFTDQYVSTNPDSISNKGMFSRKRIYGYVQKLSAHKPDSHEANTDSKSKSGSVSDPLPWMRSYCIKKAIRVRKFSDIAALDGNRYTQVCHKSTIDLTALHLTLSSLLTELSKQRLDAMQQSDNEDVDIDPFQDIHQMIVTYLELTEKTCWKWVGHHKDLRFRDMLLSAPYATAVLAHQSYIANAGAIGIDLSDRDDVQVDWSEVASEITNKFTEHVRNPKLAVFSQIHVTTGIATLAECMPSYAASIISQHSLIKNNIQTPFHMMRHALEEMEKRGDLSRESSSMDIFNGEGIVNVNEILEAFNNAIDIFSICMENDPDHIDAYLWFVATNIGAMCLGSGIVIGAGAMIAAPSEDNIYLDYSTNEKKKHRHSNYSFIRSAATKAFQMLITMTEKNPQLSGSRYHYAIISLLEWKEAVLLLAYSPQHEPSVLSKINSLHASHMYTWSLNENSDTSMYSMCSLCQEGRLSKNVLLCYLVNMIENNSKSLLYWSALANALGSIGKAYSKDEKQPKCRRKGCKDCMRVRLGMVIDHKSIKRNRQRDNWWGNGPLTWWKNYYLRFPSSKINEVRSTLSVLDIAEGLRSDFEGIPFYTNDNSYFSCKEEGVPSSSDALRDYSWTWAEEPTDEDDGEIDMQSIEDIDDHSFDLNGVLKGKRERCYDDDLPKSNKEHMVQQKGSKTSLYAYLTTNGPKVKDDRNGDACRAIAFKTIIATHLFGICTQYVDAAVYYLIRKAYSHKINNKPNEKTTADENEENAVLMRETDEYVTLKWLAERGLDIVSLCKDAEKQFEGSKQGRS